VSWRRSRTGRPARLLRSRAQELAGLRDVADLRAKQMGIDTVLAIIRTLGLCGVLYVDPVLVAGMARLFENRDAAKAHAQRRAD
jgi:hypothetical protein